MATNSIISTALSTNADVSGIGKSFEQRIFVGAEDLRQPEYTVYMHSIAKRSFNQDNAVYRNVVIPACPKDKRYITFMRITHPVQIPTVDPDNLNGPSLVRVENAKRLALSICNPNYIGADLSLQDKPIPEHQQVSGGESNLTRQGVFASMNEVPTEEELKKAEQRRHDYYKFRFEEANGLERSNPKLLQEILNLDHHMAAEYFGVDVNWHRIVSPKIECPNCGERIKEGLSHHFINGQVCVLDWEKAWLAGAVKKEDVPEPRKWWTDKKAAH